MKHPATPALTPKEREDNLVAQYRQTYPSLPEDAARRVAQGTIADFDRLFGVKKK